MKFLLLQFNSSLLRSQPRFCRFEVSENPSLPKILTGSDLEHSHHAEHGIAGGHDGANPELNLFSDAVELCADGSQLAAFRQSVCFTDVLEDVKVPGAGRIILQRSK